MMTRPSVLSASGLAASIAVIAVLLLTSNGAPQVQAATIVSKLDEQIGADELLELNVKRIACGEMELDVAMHVDAEALLGDFALRMAAGKPHALRATGTLAVDGKQGWMLVKQIEMDAPPAQDVLQDHFPPGTQTLIRLTEEDLGDIERGPLPEILRVVRSEALKEVLRRLVRAGAELGAAAEAQRDGIVLVTLPVEDAAVTEVIDDLLTPVVIGQKRYVVMEIGTHTLTMDRGSLDVDGERVAIDPQAIENPDVRAALERAGFKVTVTDRVPRPARPSSRLSGSTLKIAYDRQTERVDWFAIEEFGPSKATISVKMRQGTIERAKLEPPRSTTASLRTMTYQEFEAIGEQIGQMFGGSQ